MKEFNIDEWGFTQDSRLVILTGAGISAESGIKTFRDFDGMWENYSIEDVCTPGGFRRNPKVVIDFYNERRLQLNGVEPNPAHIAVAKLQEHLGDRCFLVTQNVDNLHERGGSKHIIHMHGELTKLRCEGDVEHVFDYMDAQDIDMKCSECGAKCRPHIVWFGEMPFDLGLIEEKVKNCTHFIYIGTSSQVYPAAGYKSLAKENGANVLAINLDTSHDYDADFTIQGYAGVEVPKFVESIIEG